MARYRMPDITPVNSTASKPVQDESKPSIDKHAYVPALRVQADHSPEQKELIRRYNSMRVKLVEADLMQDKS